LTLAAYGVFIDNSPRTSSTTRTVKNSLLAAHYGRTEARALMEMFAGAMTFRQSRMWARRPDLSFGRN